MMNIMMKKQNLILAVVCVCAAVHAQIYKEDPLQDVVASQAGEWVNRDGSVVADVLNVRVKPGLFYELLCKLKKDDRIHVIGKKDGWFEISVPSESQAWVADLYIDSKGIIVGDEVRVRAGPGVAFTPYSSLSRGHQTELRGEGRDGWQQIEPPHGATAWIRAEFVKLDPIVESVLSGCEEASPSLQDPRDTQQVMNSENLGSALVADDDPVLLESVSIEEKKGPTVKHRPALEDAIAADLAHTAPVINLPLRGMREGKVVSLKDQASEVATHVLMQKTGADFVPVCYLHSSLLNMRDWENDSVRIYGTEIWFKGWRRPVVEVNGVFLLPNL